MVRPLPLELVAAAERLGVEFVAWPADDQLRQRLARAGVPRLLVVPADAPTPVGLGNHEEWVREPVSLAAALARMEQLVHRTHRLSAEPTVISDDRVVQRGGVRVRLSPVQAALLAELLHAHGTAVSREHLVAAIWPHADDPHTKALEAVVFRLRRKLVGTGIVIRGVHALGYVIDTRDGAVGVATDRTADASRERTDPDHRGVSA